MAYPTLGLEEELFLTEPLRPRLGSLYYMARLLARNPRHYYKHSATNFARGKDVRYGLMSTVEIATCPHESPEALLTELLQRRAELAQVVDNAYIVPVGHLFDIEAPTNTGGLHLHIGVPQDQRERVYANLAHFLPLLMLLTVSSPYAGGRYFGQSYRIAHSYAIGPLREAPTYRFQDLILTRRLGTVEIRSFDPVWDVERVRWLLRAVVAIVNLPHTYLLDRDRHQHEIAVQSSIRKAMQVVQEIKDDQQRSVANAHGWPQDVVWIRPILTDLIVAFSPDGQLLATTGGFGTILIYRVSDGSLVRTLTGHTDRMWSVSFSPDGQLLASGSGDGVAVWRVPGAASN